MSRTKRIPYTEEEITELKRLAASSAKTRGSDPADSQRRKDGVTFAAEVARIRDSIDPHYTYPELGEPLGINHRTLRAKLARHKKEKLPPSQKEYTGEPYKENKRTDATFSCGHPRLPGPPPEGNTYWNKKLNIDVCATCQQKHNAASRKKRRTTKKETVSA